MTGSKPDIFHTPLLTPFASRLIHICVDLREIRTSDAHPKIPQNPCGRRDTEACTHLRGQPQNPREGRAACTKPKENLKPHGPVPWGFSHRGSGFPRGPRRAPRGGERRSGKASEPCRLRRGERCGARDDAAPRSRCPRRRRHGRHVLSPKRTQAPRPSAVGLFFFSVLCFFFSR